MNIGGFSGENTHGGDTQIFGSLTVDGQVIVRDAEGQSEYLDSGDYTPIILGVVTQWDSLILKSGTQARYAKNGNIVEVYMELTGSLKANQPFAQISISVPSVDLFDKKHIGSAYSDSVFILASGAQVYNCTNADITTSGGGSTSVLLNYDSYIASNPASVVDFFLNITYKLEGDDIPASAIIQGGGGSGGDVRNPMIETLNGGGFDILNVGNVQASTFNGGGIVNNPLSIDLNSNNKNISNVNDLDAELIEVNNLYAKTPNTTINVFNDLTFDENNIYQLSSIFNGGLAFGLTAPNIAITGLTTFNNNVSMNNNQITNISQITSNVILTDNIGHLAGPSDIFISDNIDLQTNNIKNVGALQTVNSITFNPLGTGIDMNSKTITMDGGSIDNANTIETVNIQNPTISSAIIFNSEIETNNKAINLNGSFIDNCSLIANTSNIDIKTIISPITIGPTTSGNVELSTPSGNATLSTVSGDLKLISGTSSMIMNNTKLETFSKRLEESTSSSNKVDTVHIYDASGFTETVLSIFGNDYYDLLPNVTYIIHNQITVSNGFNFNVNTAMRGQSVSCSITFDESTKDICGFRSDNQHLFLSDLTVIGGGGHFTSSTANVKGLIDFSNFNTGAPAPFYGRNKRCRIQNVQIIAPYSLGKLQGGGTLRLLGNFINGGGAQPTGIYTRVGLEVSDGLSFEFCNNKVVLMAGAQTTSTMKMLDFVNATLTPVVLGFNAVIISGNILHPRDQENAINFENDSLTQLGTISANTFIRTGGTAPLINYERATIDDNYNKSAIINYEILGNAGTIDVLPTCIVNGLVSNTVSSATFADITFAPTNIRELKGSKRFGLKSFVSGVTGGNYTTGNYIRDSANVNKFAYILDAKNILGGTDELILIDFNGQLSSVTNYEEVDKDFVLTGVTSTSFNYGSLNNEIELYYADKDVADLQITAQISHNNTGTNNEVQFALSYDTGSGYVLDNSTIVSVTNPRAVPRSNTSTITTLRRFTKGDLFKIQCRYIDVTATVVDNILITVH